MAWYVLTMITEQLIRIPWIIFGFNSCLSWINYTGTAAYGTSCSSPYSPSSRSFLAASGGKSLPTGTSLCEYYALSLIMTSNEDSPKHGF
jgi:hypothetical protein